MDEEFKGDDRFLGKDVLTFPNKVSSSRLVMFSSHLEQAVVLNKPEFPRIFTGYENEVGRYSSSYYKTDRELEIVKKIVKFPGYEESPYLLITKDEKNQYDVIERNIAEQLTEHYGYRYHNEIIDQYEEGDIIPDDVVLYQSDSFDRYGNYCYGINAKSVYLVDDRTIEDAFVISESLAKRLDSTITEEIEVTINKNDLLCNLYADEDTENKYGGYKMFPDIGENIKNSILCARRRVNNDYILFDLKNDALNQINYQNDAIFYSEGKIIDIDIYCNSDIDFLRDYRFNDQIIQYIKNQERYREEIKAICDEISSDENNTMSSDLSYLYRRVSIPEKEDFKWIAQKEFDNIIVLFRVLKTNSVTIGSKLTGRYGNKGVIAQILPDDEMPVLDNGVRADIIFNTLSIINRLGSAPLYEIELNYISDEVLEKIKKKKSLEDKEELLFKYLKMVNKDYAKFVWDDYNKSKSKEKYIKSIEKNGIYLHQPPFFDNITFDQLGDLYEAFNIKPRKAYFNGVEVKNKLIIGDQYIMKLRHDTLGKYSVRSSAYIDIRNRPSKSLSFKRHTSKYSTTPIRLGEMEINNLLLAKDSKIVAKMLSMMSTSETNRRQLITNLLTKPKQNMIERIKLKNIDNHNRRILDVLMKSLGMKIVEKKIESNDKE